MKSKLLGLFLSSLKKGTIMLHYSKALKNKHEKKYEILTASYIYEDRKLAKNVSKHLSKEIEADLNDDIMFMRRQFKHNIKTLRRSLRFDEQLDNRFNINGLSRQMRLLSRYA